MMARKELNYEFTVHDLALTQTWVGFRIGVAFPSPCEARVGVTVPELCTTLTGMCTPRGDPAWDTGVITLLTGLAVTGEDKLGLLGGSGGGVPLPGTATFLGDMLTGDEGELECPTLTVSTLPPPELSTAVDPDCGPNLPPPRYMSMFLSIDTGSVATTLISWESVL